MMGLGKRSMGDAGIADGGGSITKQNNNNNKTKTTSITKQYHDSTTSFFKVNPLTMLYGQVWWWDWAKGLQIQFQTEVGASSVLGPSRVERIELEFRLLSLPQCGGTLTLLLHLHWQQGFRWDFISLAMSPRHCLVCMKEKIYLYLEYTYLIFVTHAMGDKYQVWEYIIPVGIFHFI